MTGRIFDIQHFSIHDGPGIRTTVFLKGCPLRCRWCHNPESYSREPQLSYLPEKCIGCGYCIKACPGQAHRVIEGKHIFDRTRCVACGQCTEQCYANALELIGRDVSVDEAMKEVLADKPFYDTSDGGVTLSGGEPLMQPDFSEALLQAAKAQGLHCCCDTCGHADFAHLQKIAEVVDLFLYDLKHIDPARHEEITGVDNRLILENLRKLHDDGQAIRLRIPLIPGFNDEQANLEGIGRLTRSLPRLEGVEVMPYHKLGQSKMARLGMGGLTSESVDPQAEAIAHWKEVLESHPFHK